MVMPLRLRKGSRANSQILEGKTGQPVMRLFSCRHFAGLFNHRERSKREAKANKDIQVMDIRDTTMPQPEKL
jgi:hypothetical protein